MQIQVLQSFSLSVHHGWGSRLELHVKMCLFCLLMVLFVWPICHCVVEVLDAIIKEMFSWMGPWQMNMSLQRQRKQLSPHPSWPGMIYITIMPLARSSLSHLSMWQRNTMRSHTDSFYILEVFRVLVFQQWRRLVLRWNCDKRNQRGQHPYPLWFPLWALIYSNTRKWLLRTWTFVQAWPSYDIYIQIIFSNRAWSSVTFWIIRGVVEQFSVEEHAASFPAVV